jgi:hypothetical protein
MVSLFWVKPTVHRPLARQRPERIITTGQENAKNTLVNRECCKVQIKINPRNFSWEEKLVAPLIAAPNGEMRK